jgi:hypothetical protein
MRRLHERFDQIETEIVGPDNVSGSPRPLPEEPPVTLSLALSSPSLPHSLTHTHTPSLPHSLSLSRADTIYVHILYLLHHCVSFLCL